MIHVWFLNKIMLTSCANNWTCRLFPMTSTCEEAGLAIYFWGHWISGVLGKAKGPYIP